MNKKKLLAAAIGNCVHVAGVMHFCGLAEQEGYSINFLGPACSVDKVLVAVDEQQPDMVAVRFG